MGEIIPVNESLMTLILKNWVESKEKTGITETTRIQDELGMYICGNVERLLTGKLSTINPRRDLVGLTSREQEVLANTAFLSSGFASTKNWYELGRNELIAIAYYAFRSAARLGKNFGKPFLDELANGIQSYAEALSELYLRLRIGHYNLEL